MAEITVTLPELGESVTEGTITRWLRAEGDDIEQDDPLLEVSTDKVDTEVPSPVTGRISKLIAAEDDVIVVGGEIAIIDDSLSEAADADTSPEHTSTDRAHDDSDADRARSTDDGPRPSTAEPAGSEAEATVAKPDDTATPSGAAGSSLYLTPLVRRLAREWDVDLAEVQPTGVGGRIRKSDLVAFVEQRDSAREALGNDKDGATADRDGTDQRNTYVSTLVRIAAAESGRDLTEVVGTGYKGRIRYADVVDDSRPSTVDRGSRTEKLTRLRGVIASRMVESLQVSAQLTTVVEADVTGIVALRARAKDEFAARVGTKLTFTPFFAAAAVRALIDHPVINASVDTDAGTVTYHDTVNLALAVDTDRGLLAPVILDASALDFDELARRASDVATRTVDKTITADELTGGTFTLTNTGSRGALFDTPIINQPQVAILGTGAVVDRPRVVTDGNGEKHVDIRSVAYLALTYDHRLIDGAAAAAYLGAVKNRLEAADFEVLPHSSTR